MQRKKFLTWLLAALCVGALSFGVTACKTDEDNSVSSPSSSSSVEDSGSEDGEVSSSKDDSSSGYISEEEASQGLEYTLSKDGEQYSVTGIGTCTDTDVVIPSMYNGLPVTSIGDYAFGEDCSSLTHITISNGVTSIGDYAFNGCDSLTSIVIPDSVKSIGEDSFECCKNLKDVIIGDGVENIVSGAFYFCDNVQYNVKGGLKYLGNENNHYLYLIKTETTNITMATIDNNCKVIAGGAFYECSGLTSVTIPDSVTSIGDYAFDDCSSLEYTIKGGLKYLGNENNSYLCLIEPNATDITAATIDDNCKVIADHAFEECRNLTSINVSENNTTFSSVDGILYDKGQTKIIEVPLAISGSITIPDSVTSIGDYAFV